MTKRTDEKDLYLAALRGDVKAQRTCTERGKACGGRCIPKHWNCRIKGEGDTPPTRGNKVQLSAEQKAKIREARRSKRIRALGVATALVGGAATIGVLSAKNPHKARRLSRKGRALAGALGVAGVIPGPPRKAALAGNLGLGGAQIAGAIGANYGQNKRGRKLYAKHLSELDTVNRQLRSLDARHLKLQERLLNAKQVEEKALLGYAKRGTNKYGPNNATRSIAQQDRIRKANLTSAQKSRRKAQLALNSFYDSTGYSKLIQKQIRLKKATNNIKDILLGPYNTKSMAVGLLNDQRSEYAKGYNLVRRQIRGLNLFPQRRGPKPSNTHFAQRPSLIEDSEDHRADKKCGNSGIPDAWKCTKKTLKAAGTAAKNNPGAVADAVFLGAAGALLGHGLLASRNVRIRGKLKFGGTDRITPFAGSIGNADEVLKGFRAKKVGGDSMFGDVLIGEGKDGKGLVVKKITGNKNKLNPFADPVAMMEKQKIIDASTASNLRKQRQNIMESEVKIAKVAGEVGFGPKVVAAKQNTLIMEVAKGEPLMGKYVDISKGPLPRLKAKELSRGDKAKVLTSMAKMHTAGVAHNDMHLGNTFTTTKGAEFIDFGTAQQGGGPVAMEFVRQMNKPRVGENFWQGNGYNLKTLDPKGYRKAEGEIRRVIGKRFGTLRDNDIAKAVSKNPSLGPKLQAAVDSYYQSLVPNRRDSSERIDKPCGNSYIPQNAKCSKGAGQGGSTIQAKGGYAKFLKEKGVNPSEVGANSKSAEKLAQAYYKTKAGKAELAQQTQGYEEQQEARRKSGRRNVAAAVALGAGAGLALQALKARKKSPLGKAKSVYQDPKRSEYVKRELEKMRAKGTGKYGARGWRKTGKSFRPDDEGKKYSKTVVNPETGRKKTVKYGAKGYRIAPGTDKGDRYCARSFGDMKSHGKDCSGKDRNTPLCLSRAKWKCSGKSSRKDAAEQRLGKPCGNSHIPKAHKCSKGASTEGRSIAAQKRREKVPKDKEWKELREIEKEMDKGSKGEKNKGILTAAVAATAIGGLSIGGVLAYKNRKSIVPEISQKSIRALSSNQVKRGLNKIPGKLGEDARSLVGDAKLAAAKMGLSAQGAVCKSVNIKDNFSTWVNKDGTHLSVGSIGDSLLTFGAQRKGEVGGFPQFGLGFTIDTTYDAKGGMPPSQASKVIRTTRSMFKDQMAQLPENAVLFAVPHQDDGKGGKRKSIYESMGFASLNKSGVKGDRLWALKNQGKFTRIPPEQHDHIAKLILG